MTAFIPIVYAKLSNSVRIVIYPLMILEDVDFFFDAQLNDRSKISAQRIYF